jgi:hypothetical protein
MKNLQVICFVLYIYVVTEYHDEMSWQLETE